MRRSAMGVAIWTLLSRASGMARVLVVGGVLGPTYVANVFQAGNTLPNNVFTIFAGPMVAMVVVPTVVRASTGTAAGLGRAREVLGRVAGRLLTVAGVCAGGLVLLSPALGWSLVLGVPGPDRSRALLLAVVLILFVAPQVVLYTAISLAVAAQQSRGRFALAAGAPTVENLATIAVVLVAGKMFGSGLDVAHTPLAMIIWMGAGSTAAVVVHAGLQFYGTARVGLLTAPRWGLAQSPAARDCVRRIVVSMPVPATSAATTYVVAVIAATVPGGVLVIQFASQVFFGLSFIAGRAVSMAALPRLAAAAAVRDWPGFAVAWRKCLHYATLAALPPLCLLMLFAAPIANLVSQGELREPVLLDELGACLAIAAVGQLVSGIHDLGRRALFARLDDRGPRRASIVGFVASIVVALGAALLHPDPTTTLVTLMMAVLVGEVAGAVTVLAAVRRHIRPERLTGAGNAVRALLATLAMLPALAGGSWLLHHLASGRLVDLGVLAATTLLALVLFGSCTAALNRRRVGAEY
ncbi:MAG: putative peptidoglycan lipid flippase [Pseudonocardiales bacterium]|nr:putative peptidoglycan lipid flippase [Pseudonocardiales bacterium]